MLLHVADFNHDETIEQRVEIEGTWLRFTFFLSGSGYWELHSADGCRKSNQPTHLNRRSYVSYSPHGEAKIYFPARNRHFHLSVNVRPALVSDYLNGCREFVPTELRDICEGDGCGEFHHRGPLSPIMDVAVRDLLDCPYTGLMKRLYLESKAIELIAHKIAQIAPTDGSRRPSPGFRQDDMERVRHAEDILRHDLENPPGLFDLARSVGTNHAKLNRGFKVVFGTTVFGYLRKMRLEKAKHLLEEEGMNVSETAAGVGYNSISSFSKAFAAHFGLNPKRSQRKGP